MGAYMKGHFDFYGARGDAKREILKLTKLAAKDQSIDDLLAIAIECYSLPQREYQNISADLLKWKKKQLSDNMWLRRTAIIHQLRYKASVDKELLFVLPSLKEKSAQTL